MHVNDLLALNSASFIEAAYSTILKRQADREGFDHYMGRLELGDTKEAILVALATSTEAQRMRIDLTGLPAVIKRNGKSPWRRFSRFLSEIGGMRRRLVRIEHMLSEQRRGLRSAAVADPALVFDSDHLPNLAVAGDELSQTLTLLRDNLSYTAHDADLFIDNFKKTIRASPLFFVIGK